MYRIDSDASTPIAVVTVLIVLASVVAKLGVTAYFLLGKDPSDITSSPLRRRLFVVSKVAPPLMLWAMCAYVYNMFRHSAAIVVIVLAVIALGVTVFAWKVYRLRRSGRVLVDWK